VGDPEVGPDPEAVEDVTDLAAALVCIETENPPGNERRAAAFVADWLASRGLRTERLPEPYPKRPQVAARVGEGDPTVVLNGHLDVVPAGDRSEWRHDPYAGVREDGQLYGRGSADMKAGLAVAMRAAADLAEPLSGEDGGTLVVHGAVGEETAEPGTATLLERGYDGDYGVVLEPTGLRVATSAKGLAVYEVTVQGEASHASRPDQGENPIAATAAVLDAIRAYDHRVRRREDDLVGRAYATPTRSAAGVDSNLGVVPEQATLAVDRRLLPGEEVAAVDEEVADLLAEVAREHGIEVEWRRVQHYAPTAVDPDCGIATRLREASAAVAGVSREPWGIEAATDVRNLVNDAGMEAVTWGPGHLEQAHTVDEHVDLDSVTASLAALKRVLRDLLG
jgi:succinyl-diaminopimelate desuccinylase